MSFFTDLEAFTVSHPFREETIRGYCFHYLLCGREDAPYTLVYFVGGTGNPLGWYGHVQAMEKKYRILLVDYPMGMDRMEPLADLIGALLEKLNISRAVWIGASLGGYLAQIMGARFPEKTEAMVLYATTALTEQGIADLKQQYKAVGLLLWLIQHVPYNFLKAVALKPAFARMIPKDDPNQIAYLKEFVQWVYDDYTREKDLHMTRLMASLAEVTPVASEQFRNLRGRVLLVLPANDKAFTKDMQQGLITLLKGAQVEYTSGGHLDTLCKAPLFADLTDRFLASL